MGRVYRAGIIGCGRVAGLLEADPLRAKPCTHAGIYADPFRLVAICSHQGESFDKFQELHPSATAYRDYRQLLAKEQLDILSICTYAPSHAQISILAAKAKIPLIFCEKAMATSLDAATAMITACRRHGSQLAVNYTRRWEPKYQMLKELIAGGGIGRLLYLNGSCSGNLIHTGTHMLDLFNLYAGQPQAVRARLCPEDQADDQGASGYRFGGPGFKSDLGGTVQVEYPGGVVAMLDGRARNYFCFELDIIGSHGRVRVGNNLLEYYKPADSTHYSNFLELQPASIPAYTDRGVWNHTRENLLSCLAGSARPACTGENARAALELAVAAHASSRWGGYRLKLPLGWPYRKQEVLSR